MFLITRTLEEDKGIGFTLAPASSWVAGDDTRHALWVLLGAVTFLLLIACLNIANLLLARGTARQREIAVRIALGAGRARLMRFVMMESVLLSAFGASLGLVLAYGTVHALQYGPWRSKAFRAWPTPASIRGCSVLQVLIAAVTGVLSGLAPAMQTPASGTATAMRDGDHQTGSREQGRLRSALVTAEVAISFLLLVGAGLLIRSFSELMNVNRGFRTENRLVFSVSMPGSYYENGAGKRFLDLFFERLSTVPQVLAAGSVNERPVEGGDPGMSIDSVAAHRDPGQSAPPWAGWRIVSPGYFNAVGLPLLEGRAFDERDKPVWAERGQPDPQRRVVISQRLAKLLFQNEDAIGRRVLLWKGQSNREAEVVGVVADSRERGLTAGPALTVYLPYGRNALTPEFVLHTRGNPLAVASTVRAIATSLDPNLPVADVRSFDEIVHRSVAPERLNAILLTVFGGLALLLASTGIYGVLAYSMNRRTPEIGLRVALGASRRNILKLTFSQGMTPALLGIALGALGAWWLSRYLGALLFGVKPFDALTYAAVALLLLATALLACLVPGPSCHAHRSGSGAAHRIICILIFCVKMTRRILLTGIAGMTAARALAQQDPYSGKKKVLAIGDVHTGYQHDSVSHALATIERLGRESGLFVTYIRTDTQLVTRDKIYGTGRYAAPPEGTRGVNAKNLNYFDAIFFYGLGEEELSDKQKADLLSFVHDDGKGFVGAHSAIDAFFSWPEYGEMLGAYFDNHPWGVLDAPIIVEEPSFPGMKQFPGEFVTRDEIYVPTNAPYSRDKVDVLARLDTSKVDLKVKDLHRTDGDLPVAWVKKYGKGNVFYSTLGHPDEAWDNKGIQEMYLEAITWALGLTSYTPRPHPLS